MRKGSSIATLSMLTPKHTIWDESQMHFKHTNNMKFSNVFVLNLTSGNNIFVPEAFSFQ
jgi:hypothetical protein